MQLFSSILNSSSPAFYALLGLAVMIGSSVIRRKRAMSAERKDAAVNGGISVRLENRKLVSIERGRMREAAAGKSLRRASNG
jgi:hypothetical protein